MPARFRDRQPGAPFWQLILYEICRKTCMFILRVFFRLKDQGLEHVPRSGACLVAANHESYLDPPSIGGPIRRHTAYIARAGLFTWRPFAWLIRSLNSIPIREDQGDVAAIKEAIRRLESGQIVLIFPEGSRSPDGSLQEFKRGVSLLLKKAKCPVVPAAIDGAHEAWPRKGLPRPFRRVRVRYGAPIPYDELMKDGPDGALQRIRAEIITLRAALEQDA